MSRTHRILLCIGLLWGSLLFAQQPALMNGAQAVRFEQSPGFFHYVVFCQTAKEFTAQMPAAKLPPDSMEYGLCWYVHGSLSRGSAVSPEADGRLVISPHHVRFMPGNPQSADVYADLHPEQVELKHDPGQPFGLLQSNDLVFRFQFSELCLTCAPGTPTPPGEVPVLLDQEFTLLDETIRHFYSGWKQIYRLSSGKHPESQSIHQASTAAGASGMRSSHEPTSVVAAKPSLPAASNPGASVPAKSASADASPVATETLRTKPVKIAPGAAVGLLIKKVSPSYPLDAKLLRLEGTVVLRAVIERTGEVAEVYALSGPPLLESAAVDAVKQWQYRPYARNGQPVDVETTIEVVFALDGSHPVTRAQNAGK
jgi:TonB family protein